MIPVLARRATLFGFALMGGVSTVPIPAQEAAGHKPDQIQDDTITVEGRRAKDLDRVVDALAPSRGGRQIAKWEWSVCVRVIGLEPSHATFLRTRIETAADALKVPIDRQEQCTPNIVVVFTDKPRDVLLDIRKREPELLRDPQYGLARKSEWEQLMAPRPVTWMGRDEVDDSVGGGSFSRLKAQTRQLLTKTIAIIDARDIAGVTWGQLGDYLCMVTLSRPKLDAKYDASTILGLFAMRDAARPLPPALTSVDRGLLTSLYAMDGQRPAFAQRKILQRQVADAVSKP